MKKIILALDNVTNLEEAISITKTVQTKILTVKIGLQMWNLFGRNGVKKFNDIGVSPFLDLKIIDIPETCRLATLALKGLKLKYLSVMALGSNKMIKAVKEAANEIDPDIRVLSVTVLTSISQNELNNFGINSSVESTVVRLAQISSEADGFVSSALEAKLLRKEFPNKLILCPGLRLPGDPKQDQVRIATPALAIKNGADACILGRSLLQDGNINKTWT